MKLILSHGIRTRDPRKHFGGIEERVSDKIEVVYADYGYILFPLTNSRAVDAIEDVFEPGDILAGFSNGGYAAWKFCQRGFRPRHVFLISPALRKDATFPVPTTCFYSNGDGIVTKGKWWGRTVSMLPHRWGRPNYWGEMGRFGAKSKQIDNIQLPDCVSHAFYRHDYVQDRIAESILSVAA